MILVVIMVVHRYSVAEGLRISHEILQKFLMLKILINDLNFIDKIHFNFLDSLVSSSLSNIELVFKEGSLLILKLFLNSSIIDSSMLVLLNGFMSLSKLLTTCNPV